MMTRPNEVGARCTVVNLTPSVQGAEDVAATHPRRLDPTIQRYLNLGGNTDRTNAAASTKGQSERPATVP